MYSSKHSSKAHSSFASSPSATSSPLQIEGENVAFVDSRVGVTSEDTSSEVASTSDVSRWAERGNQSADEARMAILKRRFAKLTEEDFGAFDEDADERPSGTIEHNHGIVMENRSTEVVGGKKRWDILRRTLILSSPNENKKEKEAAPPAFVEEQKSKEDNSVPGLTREDELVALDALWEDAAIPPPPPAPSPPPSVNLSSIAEQEEDGRDEKDEDRIDAVQETVQVSVAEYLSDFELTAKQRSLNVSKLPHELVEAQVCAQISVQKVEYSSFTSLVLVLVPHYTSITTNTAFRLYYFP